LPSLPFDLSYILRLPTLTQSIAAQRQKIETMARNVSAGEVSKHNIPEDLWIVVNENVYNMTEYANEHPGGAGSTCSSWPSLPSLTSQ
jgi:cytochrome b involved in lipid metabolism